MTFNYSTNMTPIKNSARSSTQANHHEFGDTQNIIPGYYIKQTDMKGIVYKLSIRVDKIRARPGPKSKKIAAMMLARKKKLIEINNKLKQQLQAIEMIDLDDPKWNKYDDYTSQSTFNSQEDNLTSSQDATSIDKPIQCPICKEYFNSIRTLYAHKKTHYICKYCDIVCDNQLLCEEHEKLHQSIEPMFPYKCHLCTEMFDNKENLKAHNEQTHSETVGDENFTETTNKPQHQCEICRIVLADEQSYRTHLLEHTEQVIILEANPVKENACKVCFKEFNTIEEAQEHTARAHIEIIEAMYKCKVCKKMLETEQLLNDHLSNHLSRAHHCQICRKIFINRTTLMVHMKTHNKDK